jgi:hypothetical protein
VALLLHCCVLDLLFCVLDLVFSRLLFLFRLLVALLPRLGILVWSLFWFLCFWKWIFFLLLLLVDTLDVLLPGTCYFLVVSPVNPSA